MITRGTPQSKSSPSSSPSAAPRRQKRARANKLIIRSDGCALIALLVLITLVALWMPLATLWRDTDLGFLPNGDPPRGPRLRSALSLLGRFPGREGTRAATDDSSLATRRRGTLGESQPRTPVALGDSSTQDTSRATTNTTGSTVPVVAYVITITQCGVPSYEKVDSGSHWKEEYTLVDAAAVFARAVRLASHPLHPTSPYGSKLYAIVHQREAKSRCVGLLSGLGFEVLIRDEPVPNPLSHLMKTFPKMEKKFPGRWPPRPYIEDEGCCGSAEFIKLRALELTDHPLVVLLDLDSLVLRPLDELFDALMWSEDEDAGSDRKDQRKSGPGGGTVARGVESARRHLAEGGLVAPTYRYVANHTNHSFSAAIDGIEVMAGQGEKNSGLPTSRTSLPPRIHAFYTKDWCNAKPATAQWVGVQGGFLVARPNLHSYNDFKSILMAGNYVMGHGAGSGWGGAGYGRHIYASMTFQGLAAYYYEVVAPKFGIDAVELNRCRFNQMADNPRLTVGSKFPRATPLHPRVAGYRDGACRDGRRDCDDVQCQTWPVDDVRSVHFTNCRKPWTCPEPEWNTTMEGTCRAMHREWFKIRRGLEAEWEGGEGGITATGNYLEDTFLGYCRTKGPEGYIRMKVHGGS